MYKSPYKHKFLAGSSKCSIKPLSILFTKLLTHIKQGLQKYIVLQNSLLEKWDQSDVDPFFFFFFFFFNYLFRFHAQQFITPRAKA